MISFTKADENKNKARQNKSVFSPTLRVLASNMSEVLSIFFATLMGFTILKPVHLLWINLVTDCFPALALGMEKAEPNIMKRKPRDAKAGIFADGMGVDILYQGVMVTVLVLISYFMFVLSLFLL